MSNQPPHLPVPTAAGTTTGALIQHDPDQTDTEQKRVSSIAEMFKPDPRMEAVRKLQDEDPEAFARLSSQTRLALAFYLQGEAAFKAHHAVKP